MNDLLFTPSGVRLRRRVERSGGLNWLLLPGGPGIGSESLHELADTLDVPGCIWMVDLPGDGSNTVPPNATEDPFERWPKVLLEAATTLQNCVYVGHSTGGMYLLSTPELEANVVGLALLSTAPDASWRSHFMATTQEQPLPKVNAAMAAYEKEPSYARLRDLIVASAEWNFSPAALEVGRTLLSRMPYNPAAMEWSDLNFDKTYVSTWWPSDVPTLILAGEHDRIVGQEGWKDPKFGGANVQRVAIEAAGHFPWIENPYAVRREFGRFAQAILRRRHACEREGGRRCV